MVRESPIWGMKLTLPSGASTGPGTMDPTPRIPTWGTLRTGVKLWTPRAPRFVTVKVPPASSSGVMPPLRQPSARRRASRAISLRPQGVRVPDHGDHEAARRINGKCQVHGGILPQGVARIQRIQLGM